MRVGLGCALCHPDLAKVIEWMTITLIDDIWGRWYILEAVDTFTGFTSLVYRTVSVCSVPSTACVAVLVVL